MIIESFDADVAGAKTKEPQEGREDINREFMASVIGFVMAASILLGSTLSIMISRR